MNAYISDQEIREVYQEDTVGRKYRVPIVSKNNTLEKGDAPKEAVTLKLNQPMSYNEFKLLSDNLKIMYIKHLRQCYKATRFHVAEALGINPSTVSHRIIEGLGLKGLFTKGPQMNDEQKKAWDKFMGKREESTPTEVVEDVKPIETEAIEVNPVNPVATAEVCSFHFMQKGRLNMYEFCKRLNSMIAEGTDCVITVRVDVE